MKIKIQLGSFETELVLALTDAPVNYDGFHTFTLQQFDYPLGGTKNNARLVAMRSEHATWQLGRYHSGWNVTLNEENFDKEFSHFTERELIDMLWLRITGLEGK